MIYLDNAATSLPSKAAISKAQTYLTEKFFNPSALYKNAFEVKKDLDIARRYLLTSSGFGKEYGLIFTSGGTESDNLAVFGSCKRGNFVTTAGEHSAVHNSLNELKSRGFEVRLAPLNGDGSVNVEKLTHLIDKDTTFVSVVHVNNETGAINDISKISQLIKKINPSVIFHSDGVQAFGKIKCAPGLSVDLYSASAHKIGGVKGAGFLIFKDNNKLKAAVFGGGQEFNLRSGTENVFGIKCMEFAAREMLENFDGLYNHVKKLNVLMRERLDKDIFTIISSERASAYILSVSAKGLRGEVLQHMLEDAGVICGTGSACSSKTAHSRIIKECGFEKSILEGVIRLSFSPRLSAKSVLQAADIINKTALELKNAIL